MRNLKTTFGTVLAALLLAASAAFADEAKETATQPMPEMGPPKELADMEWMIGTWDVATRMRMDPASEDWQESKAEAVYSKTVGGAAIQTNFKGMMMGMPFEGMSLTCYDRELQQWQSTWVDNMSARIGLYTGKCDKAGSVFQGEEMWMGRKSLGRMTTVNKTPTSFDWRMESSFDGGTTWAVTMTATYAKRTK